MSRLKSIYFYKNVQKSDVNESTTRLFEKGKKGRSRRIETLTSIKSKTFLKNKRKKDAKHRKVDNDSPNVLRPITSSILIIFRYLG